jgi:hypothetical protein
VGNLTLTNFYLNVISYINLFLLPFRFISLFCSGVYNFAFLEINVRIYDDQHCHETVTLAICHEIERTFVINMSSSMFMMILCWS